MINLFNPDSIKTAKDTIKTAPSGFRYGFIPNIFKEDVYEQLIASFPDVSTFKLVDKPSGGGRKRFYVGPGYDANKNWGCVCHLSSLPQIWKDALHESSSNEFMKLLKDSTGVGFNTMCTFGFAYGNEGCMQEAHIDGAAREGDKSPVHSTIACLLYFNKEAGGVGGTCVYDIDRKTVLFQAPSLRNGLFFFEQHPDAWHGYPPMPPGADRRIISLAYSQESQPVTLRTSVFHRLTCVPTYKRIAKKLLR